MPFLLSETSWGFDKTGNLKCLAECLMHTLYSQSVASNNPSSSHNGSGSDTGRWLGNNELNIFVNFIFAWERACLNLRKTVGHLGGSAGQASDS